MNVRRQPVGRRAIDVELDSALLSEAQALGLDTGAVLEAALRESVAAEKERRWRDENAGAIAQSNEELRANGLWSDAQRLF